MSESPFEKLREQERESRKQLILDTAVDLFSKHPIPEVSMRDISKAAGISPALIYRYFTDRDELFVEAFLKKSEEMIQAFRNSLTKEKTLTLETLSLSFVDFLFENGPFFRMMTYFMLDSTLKEDYVEKFNKSIRSLLAVMEEVFQAGGLQQDLRLHTHALFAALNGILITYHRYPGREEEESRQHIRRLAGLIAKRFEPSSL